MAQKQKLLFSSVEMFVVLSGLAESYDLADVFRM